MGNQCCQRNKEEESPISPKNDRGVNNGRELQEKTKRGQESEPLAVAPTPNGRRESNSRPKRRQEDPREKEEDQKVLVHESPQSKKKMVEERRGSNTSRKRFEDEEAEDQEKARRKSSSSKKKRREGDRAEELRGSTRKNKSEREIAREEEPRRKSLSKKIKSEREEDQEKETRRKSLPNQRKSESNPPPPPPPQSSTPKLQSSTPKLPPPRRESKKKALVKAEFYSAIDFGSLYSSFAVWPKNSPLNILQISNDKRILTAFDFTAQKVTCGRQLRNTPAKRVPDILWHLKKLLLTEPDETAELAFLTLMRQMKSEIDAKSKGESKEGGVIFTLPALKTLRLESAAEKIRSRLTKDLGFKDVRFVSDILATAIDYSYSLVSKGECNRTILVASLGACYTSVGVVNIEITSDRYAVQVVSSECEETNGHVLQDSIHDLIYKQVLEQENATLSAYPRDGAWLELFFRAEQNYQLLLVGNQEASYSNLMDQLEFLPGVYEHKQEVGELPEPNITQDIITEFLDTGQINILSSLKNLMKKLDIKKFPIDQIIVSGGFAKLPRIRSFLKGLLPPVTVAEPPRALFAGITGAIYIGAEASGVNPSKKRVFFPQDDSTFSSLVGNLPFEG